jgi:hypothetical protein
MKKITLLLIFALVSVVVFAQYQAGNILVSGTLIFGGSQSKESFGGTSVDGTKNTTFEIGPGIEYFLTDVISAGAEIGFSSYKEVDKNPGGGLDETIDKTSITTITPFASMYFINEEKFGLFCKLGVGFGFGKNVYEEKTGNTSVSVETKLSSFEVGIRPGITVHLSERFGMSATFCGLGFHSTKSKRDIGGNTLEDKSSEYGFELIPSLGFGIYFKLK